VNHHKKELPKRRGKYACRKDSAYLGGGGLGTFLPEEAPNWGGRWNILKGGELRCEKIVTSRFAAGTPKGRLFTCRGKSGQKEMSVMRQDRPSCTQIETAETCRLFAPSKKETQGKRGGGNRHLTPVAANALWEGMSEGPPPFKKRSGGKREKKKKQRRRRKKIFHN